MRKEIKRGKRSREKEQKREQEPEAGKEKGKARDSGKRIGFSHLTKIRRASWTSRKKLLPPQPTMD